MGLAVFICRRRTWKHYRVTREDLGRREGEPGHTGIAEIRGGPGVEVVRRWRAVAGHG